MKDDKMQMWRDYYHNIPTRLPDRLAPLPTNYGKRKKPCLKCGNKLKRCKCNKEKTL